MVNDLSYFQRRAAQERASALRAAHPRARQAHLALAHDYETLIGRLAANERKLEPFEQLLRIKQTDDFNALLDAIDNALVRHQCRSRLDRFHRMLERDNHS